MPLSTLTSYRWSTGRAEAKQTNNPQLHCFGFNTMYLKCGKIVQHLYLIWNSERWYLWNWYWESSPLCNKAKLQATHTILETVSLSNLNLWRSWLFIQQAFCTISSINMSSCCVLAGDSDDGVLFNGDGSNISPAECSEFIKNNNYNDDYSFQIQTDGSCNNNDRKTNILRSLLCHCEQEYEVNCKPKHNQVHNLCCWLIFCDKCQMSSSNNVK